MTQTLTNDGALSDFACPVCGKAQPNPDTNAHCARCGTALADAVRGRQAAQSAAVRGLQALPHDPRAAIAHLEAAYRLRPETTLAKRLACAYLLNKQYDAALCWRQVGKWQAPHRTNASTSAAR